MDSTNFSGKIYLQKIVKLVGWRHGVWARICSGRHDVPAHILLQDWRTESPSCWDTASSGNILAEESSTWAAHTQWLTDVRFKGPAPSRGNSEGPSSLQSSLKANWDLDWVCMTAQLHPLHNPCPSLPQLLIPRALLINILHANLHFRFRFPGNSTVTGSDQVTFRGEKICSSCLSTHSPPVKSSAFPKCVSEEIFKR